jgi:hypothetical protein
VKSFARLAVALACVALAFAAPPVRAAGTVTCLSAIPAEMIDTLDSATARPGRAFRFMITEDSTIQLASLPDPLPVPRWTLGWGVVRAVSSASRGNHYGSLTLEPRYLVLPDGRVVQVSMNPTLPASISRDTPGVEKAISHVPIPIPGLAMTAVNTLRRGRDVIVGLGFTFSVVPIRALSLGPDC